MLRPVVLSEGGAGVLFEYWLAQTGDCLQFVFEFMHPPQSENSSRRNSSGLAIASLVTGLVGVFPLAIAFGFLALSRIRKNNGQIKGASMAKAGVILGCLGLILSIAAPVAVPKISEKLAAMRKENALREQCVSKQLEIQKTMRAYQSEKGLKAGDPLDIEDFLPRLGDVNALACPVSGSSYVINETIPDTGVPVCKCPLSRSMKYIHLPGNTDDW